MQDSNKIILDKSLSKKAIPLFNDFELKLIQMQGYAWMIKTFSYPIRLPFDKIIRE